MQELNPVAERLISSIMSEMFDANGQLTLPSPHDAGIICSTPYCVVMCIKL